MEEEANDIADDETGFSTRVEKRATRDLVVAAVIALNQRAVGENEIECKSGQDE